jgi:4a-hydroxytetrahydrobiopterin dehydratase
MQKNWEQIPGKLVKTFQFKDFEEALKFINSVGQIAESMNHHPKIVNLYNTVTIELWTHDQNAITDMDFKLADEIDRRMTIS